MTEADLMNLLQQARTQILMDRVCCVDDLFAIASSLSDSGLNFSFIFLCLRAFVAVYIVEATEWLR